MLLPRLALALCAVACAAGAARAAEPEPFELVRSLRALQDEIAHGNATAHVSQRTLMVQISEQMLRARPDAWKEPRNARAAVAFVLSGGDPRILKMLVAAGSLADVDDKLARGVVAYGERRNNEAAELLAGINARTLEVSIAGQVSLVQSELTAGKDTEKAMALLDEARLLSPGTLIEEAALRRQVALVASAADVERYEALSSRYLRRFPKSVYAGGFRRQLAIDMVSRPGAVDPESLSRLSAALGGLDPADRSDFYLMMAKEGLLRGKVAIVRFAAKQAAGLAEPQSAEGARARIYESAVLVVTDEYETALAALEATSAEGLGQEDVELLESALSVAAEVRRVPAPTDVAARARPEHNATVERARQAIASVDQLISGAGK